MIDRMAPDASLRANPFWVLGVSTRDDRRRIVEQAEDRSLHIDHDLCQKARSNLTAPRSRLAAELGWMPGVAPQRAVEMVRAALESEVVVHWEARLPDLARANLMAAQLENVCWDEPMPVSVIAGFLCDLSWLVETVDPEEVVRDINEDRAIAGFPEVGGVEAVEEELAERRRAYLSAMKRLLNSMSPERLVDIMNTAVNKATTGGARQGPALLDDLVDGYEVEAQVFLQKERETIAALIDSARRAAPGGQQAVSPIIEKLGRVARNWDRVAQPIQLSMKSRGIEHRPSRDLAYELRSLAVDLNNEHDMLDQAARMTQLLHEVFAELPEVAERLSEDAEAIAKLRRDAQESASRKAQWERDITFRASVGILFKDELAISPRGVTWGGRGYTLDAVTGVRWGGVRNSINGIPTGTEFTIGFGDSRSELAVQLRDESIFTKFVECLWRGVGVRLMFEIVNALKEGHSLSFGDITVEDAAVTLVRRRVFGSSEHVRLGWNSVQIWSANGELVVGSKLDNRVNGAASYIRVWNTHILEHIIRRGFEKGIRKLSDVLGD